MNCLLCLCGCLLVGGPDARLDEKEVLATYRPHLDKLVAAYSDHIRLKELKIEHARTDPAIREQTKEIRICGRFVSLHHPGVQTLLSDSTFFGLKREKADTAWELFGYKFDMPAEYARHRYEVLTQVPWSCKLAFQIGYPNVDARDLFHEGPPPREKYAAKSAFVQAPKLVAIRRQERSGGFVYRIYFKMIQWQGAQAVEGTTQKHDGIDCAGFADVSPHLGWVVVGGVYRDNTWSVDYEGTISGVPAIKKTTFKRDEADPFITHDVLAIERLDQVNPAEYTPEHYGLQVPTNPNAPPEEPYLWFIIVAALVLLAFGAAGVHLLKRRQANVVPTI